MKTVNLDYFVKSVLALLIAGFVAGCGDEPEEVAKKNQDTEAVTEFIQSDEIVAESDPIYPEPEAAESGEETLESILEKADEIIQRTESSISALNGDTNAGAKQDEAATGITEESESYLAAVPEPSQDVQQTVDDSLDVVKATPDLIRRVQQALTDAGFNPGSADGKLGPRTMGALKDFQQQNNLAVGKFTKETLRELGVSF